MTKRTLCMVLAWLVLAIPASLDAQGVGSRLRQRVQGAVSGDKKEEQAEFDKSKVFTGDVIEISEAGIKGLQNGLDTELRLLREFAALLGTYKSPEDYQRCEQETAMSPEGMEIMGRMANIPDNATPEEMQRIIARVNEDFVALKKTKCGPSIVEDWPQTRRAENLKEIGMKAAAAAGPVRSFSPTPQGGPSPEDDAPVSEPVQEGLPYQTYLIMKERIDALCRFLELSDLAGNEIPPDARLEFAASVLDASADEDDLWVFLPDEIKAILPLCPKFTLTMGEIRLIIELPPINLGTMMK